VVPENTKKTIKVNFAVRVQKQSLDKPRSEAAQEQVWVRL
jgi:hypothetical protein